jgi:hypothetical protein
MYKIRSDEDWSFLMSKVLTQLCIGQYDVQLRFNGNICISIQGEEPTKSFQHRTGEANSSSVGGMPGAAISLVSLLGASIQSVIVEDGSTLMICFSNQEQLRIYDSSDAYESFTISGPNKMIVV